jgi:hypothetical protein
VDARPRLRPLRMKTPWGGARIAVAALFAMGALAACGGQGGCDYHTPGAQPGSAQDLRDQQHAAAGDLRSVPY